MRTISERLRSQGRYANEDQKQYANRRNSEREEAADVIDEMLAALALTAAMYERATGLPMPSQAYRALARARKEQP